MKTYQKIIIIIGIAIALFIAAFIFIFSWEGSPKKIIEAADQFQPPTSWKLVSENTQGPRIICLDGGGCPRISRGWYSNEPLSYETLLSQLQQTDWTYTFDDRCQTMDRPTKDATYYSCVVYITTDVYDGSIYTGQSSKPEYKYSLILNLGPQ